MSFTLSAFGRLFGSKAPVTVKAPVTPKAPATPQKLVCIGHSHTEPIAAAAQAAGIAVDILNFWHMPGPFVTENGRQRLAPPYRERLAAPVFSLIGGAVHQDVGLVQHPRPFDFILPGYEDMPLQQGAELIPFGAVHAAMLARTQPYLDIMSAVRGDITGKMFHMQSPPTYANEELPQNDPGFYHIFGENAAFSPAWLRAKLWRVHSGIVENHCRAVGIRFMPHPPEAVTGEGFLREEFHGTPAHANAAYGALVLAQMQHANLQA